MAVPRQSSNARSPNEPITVEEYLAFERGSPVRHEYVDGYVYAFAGSTRRHNRIILNLVSALANAVDARGCEMHSEMVQLRASETKYYYPDLMIGCDPTDDDEYEVERPCVVAEVLSRSTSRNDRLEKLNAYQQIPSLQCYLVISQTQRRIDWHVRGDDGAWETGTSIGDGSVQVPPFDVEVSLDAIYSNVRLGPEPDAAAPVPGR